MVTIQELYDIYLNNPKISKDTREDVNGSIYFALTGPNFNGNKFAERAIEKGAAYAVVDDLSVLEQPDHPRLLHVENALRALQQLATYHREQFEVPFLAITGSNGKTTTKELIASVLSRKYKVHFTQGNYNNHIGIPLTLLKMKSNVEMVVLEMGASAQKEIQSYCRIAKPNYGLITNVGRAHLEGFGGVEGVRKGKGELYDYLAKGEGVVFINSDEPYLDRMAYKVPHKFIYHSGPKPESGPAQLVVQLIRTEPSVLCKFKSHDGSEYMIESSLMGNHNFMNIMSAIAVGHYFKVPGDQIKRAIERYRSSNNRSQIFQFEGVKYVKDAYNANPDSVRSILQSYSNWSDPKKVLVLGDMLELGANAQAAHQEIVDDIIQMNCFDEVYLVGELFYGTKVAPNFYKYLSVQDLKKDWSHARFRGQTVLLKGSRGIALEQLLDY